MIPVKARSEGKGRLSGVLSPAQRQRMTRLMLEDVVNALGAASSITGIAVVSAETVDLGARILHLADPGSGLNAAVGAGVTALAACGATALVVLHSDLPLLTASDVDALVLAGHETGLALAPDCNNQGTNAIYLALPSAFRFHFGTMSFERHQAEARLNGTSPAILQRPGLGFDVDEPTDLQRVIAEGGNRYAFLLDALTDVTL